MFFENLTIPAPWKSNTSIYSNFNKLLSENSYNIYFYYDENSNCLYFIAGQKQDLIDNNSKEPLVVSFLVDQQLNIECDSMFGTSSSDQAAALYYYLLDKEKTSTDEKRKTFYDSLPTEFASAANYSSMEYKERTNVRRKFESLLSRFDDFNVPASVNQLPASKYRIGINLHSLNNQKYIGERTVEISLTFTNENRTYQVSNALEFFQAYTREDSYDFSNKTSVTLKRSFFDGKSVQIVDFLIKNRVRASNNYYKFQKPIDLLQGDFIELLKLLGNETIEFVDFKKQLQVVPQQPGKVIFSSNKSICIEPDIRVATRDRSRSYPINSLCYLYQNYFLYIDINKNTINLIKLKNRNACLLYTFIATLQYPLKEEYVDDLLAKYIGDNLLLVGDSAKEDNDFRIMYTATLNIKRQPVFKTSYIYNGVETKELAEASKNIIFRSKIKIFHKLLNEDKLMENGIGQTYDIVTLLTTDFSKYEGIADILVDESILNIKVQECPEINITAKYNNDWLDIKARSNEYSPEEIYNILNAYQRKKSYVLINDRIIKLNEEDSSIAELAEISNDFNFNTKMEASVPSYNIFKLTTYENRENNNSITFEVDDNAYEIIDEIRNYKNNPVGDELDKYPYLREYQKDGIKWLFTLYKRRLSGILADDMGLGKTLQTITFISLIYGEKPILIITPKSLVYNWQAEIEKWAPEMDHTIIKGNKISREKLIRDIPSTHSIYLTSYDSVRNDIDDYASINFGLVVLDEGQYIKNDSALKTKAVKQLDADGKVVLTGTPIENSLDNLWSIFDFLMPGYLGMKSDFLDKYEDAFLDNAKNNNDPIRKELLAKITPFILRRTKEEVLPELPPKTEKVIKIEMSEKQAEYYEAYRESVVNEIELEPKKKVIKILTSLTNLRIIAVDPASFMDNYNETSNKLAYAIDLIVSSIATNHKVVVFSFFVKVLDRLKDLLKKERIDSFTIKGDVDAKDRLEISNIFNTRDGVKVLLCSLKAGGVGLNFTGADTVIHLDPWWNVAVENQASDRTHRIGQTRPVTIYKLVSYGTIEDKILTLQENKKNLYDSVIRSGDDFISKMTDEDIKFLLS